MLIKNYVAWILLFTCFYSSVVFATQCAPYARNRSGIQITGDAWTWWNQANSEGYNKGSIPQVGSVMSMPKWGGNIGHVAYGHVAYVTRIISDTEIVVDHANWYHDGTVHVGQHVKDVSSNKDWSKVKIWWHGSYGATEYSINGFIYPGEAPTFIKTPVDVSCVANICWTPPTSGNPNGCWDADHVYLEEYFDKNYYEVAKNFCQAVLNHQEQLAQAAGTTDTSESIPHDTLTEIGNEEPRWYSFFRSIYLGLKNIIGQTARANYVRAFTVERTFYRVSANNLELIHAPESPLGVGLRRSKEESGTPPALPDFIVSRTELQKDGIEKYKFLPNTSVDAVAWIKNVGDADWAPDENGITHSEIEVRFYLSDGYKEDSHSEWDRTGSEIIQRYNLELIDPAKKESDGFTTPSQLGTYNIVVCADRNKDSGNRDGDVVEMHKSNNCSSEAVFEVVAHDLEVFDFWRAHNPIYATADTGYDNFEARFKILNKASSTQYVEDIRIDAYKNDSFELTCWQKGSGTNIGAGLIYELDNKFCEIPTSGSYHLEAKLKIDGKWVTLQTHPSFDVLPALDLEVYDFYQKPEPIYATNGDGTMNFYTGLKIKNNTSVPVIFKWIHIEAYRDGLPIFQCYKKTTSTILQPGQVFDPGHRVCDFWNPGEYHLRLNVHLDSAVGWRTFAEFPAFKVIQTGSAYTDLQVPSSSISKSEIFPEERVNISATVKNFGNVSSSSSTIKFVLSEDATITEDDLIVLSRDVISLTANGSVTRSISNTPVNAHPGIYWFGACVTPVSNESSILNNCSVAKQLSVIEQTRPDLIVQSPSVSDSAQTPGQSFTASATVRNLGNGPSPSTTLRYYRSTDSIISTGDTQLNTDGVAALSPGRTSPESNNQTAPNTTGTYWIGACVDEVSGESNTGNNCSSGVQVIVNQPSYTLSVSKSGTGSGTVTSSPSGINCGTDCSQAYTQGTSVTLTATAATGGHFFSWGGACTGSSSCVVVLTADKNVVAYFSPTPATPSTPTASDGTYTDKVRISWSSVSGATSYRVFRCTNTLTTSCSTLITGTSSPYDDTSATVGTTYYYRVAACSSGGCGNASNYDTGYRAVVNHTLSVSKTGNGTVTSVPSGINCGTNCSHNYIHRTSVTLTATPVSGWSFNGWGGVCSGTGSCVVNMTANKSVSASFSQNPIGDQYEPDNTSGQATNIRTGISQSHSIVPATDVDWVWFDVNKQTEVTLETFGQTGDTVLILYDDTLAEIAQNDDKGDGTLFSKIQIPDLAPGKYYARVSPFGLNSGSSSEVPAYTIVLTIKGEKKQINIMPILMLLLDDDSSINHRADVNGDGSINVIDAALIQRFATGLDMTGTGWIDSPITGDVNCDGVTNVIDATLVQRFVSGLDMTGTQWCAG